MSRIADRIALIATAVVVAALVWAVLHYSGDWFFLAATIIAFAVLLADNHRLKKRVRELGGDSRERR
ncbi:hypothetical protein [Burkholderia pyrrocinia]|uniref:hypothetical protein n=1 Tax=Burkholderia pyrrocinia TaxID=60550 RepID=UPI001BCF6CBF|nr:hypothetical protein [Burkholderia pyrrocinia]QVN19418.1 hypothetical protein JYG32_06780 [Burkholderia pyrrocinia]